MFWQTIQAGFKIFSNPSVMGMALLLGLLYLAFLATIRLATGTPESAEAAGPGCLIQVIGLLFQSILVALFVLLLLPILLGVTSKISWHAVEPMGFIAARAGILALILVTLISFFPYIGPFLASSPGLEIFLMATLTFRFLTPYFLESLLGKGLPFRFLFPGTMMSLAYFCLAWAFSRGLMLCVLILVHFLQNHFPSRQGTVLFLKKYFGPSLDILGGILAFFMYAHYVAMGLPGL